MAPPPALTQVSADADERLEQPFAAPEQRSDRTRAIRRVLIAVLGLNLIAAAGKLGYGIASGSVAMSADGVQSLLDGVGNVVGLIGIAIAARPPDRDHQYGHERYETIASMAIAGLIAIGVVEVIQTAIGQLRSGDRPEVTGISFGVLLVSIAINGGVSFWERRAGRRVGSDLLVADSKHTASDVFVSGAVIVGLAAERIGLSGADAVMSVVIAAMMAWAAWTIVRDASLVLTDASIADPRQLMATVLAVPGVITAHNLRARSLGGRLWVEVHVTVDPWLSIKQGHEVATGVEASLRDGAGPLAQAIIHVEPAEPPHTRPDPLFGGGEPA